MKPSKVAGDIETVIQNASTVFEKSVATVQERFYDRVLASLKNLELDSRGYIKQNAFNRKILTKAQSLFDEAISSASYRNAITKHLSVISNVNELNNDYFQSINKKFKPNKTFLKSLERQAVRNINQMILQDGIKAQIKIPLNKIIEQNISTGGRYRGLLDQLKQFMDGEGNMVRFSSNYLKDLLFEYSRSFQESLTGDLNLDWYLYSGGLTDTSREFCIERSGKFFHRTEIQSWAKRKWKGKAAGTTESSIFVLLGGYNCTHSLIPVSEFIVPKEDLDRIK